MSRARGRNPLRGRGGMTLVEVIVAVAIIGLAALILSSAFGASMNLVRRGADSQSAGNQAFAQVEMTAVSDPGGVTITFEADGEPITVNGQYVEVTQTVKDSTVTFRAFESEGVASP